MADKVKGKEKDLEINKLLKERIEDKKKEKNKNAIDPKNFVEGSKARMGGGKVGKPIKYEVGGMVKPAYMRNR